MASLDGDRDATVPRTLVVGSNGMVGHELLETGECLDDASVSLPTFAVRVGGGMVQVAAP